MSIEAIRRGVVLIKSCIFAAVAVLVFATPALAEQVPICDRPEEDFDTVSIQYNRFGNNPVAFVTARDAHVQNFGNFSITWDAVYEAAQDILEVRMRVSDDSLFSWNRVVFSLGENGEGEYLLLAADQLRRNSSYRGGAPYYALVLDPAARKDPVKNGLFQALVDGTHVWTSVETYVSSTASSDGMLGQLLFSSLGERRSQARRWLREETEKVRSGACRRP